MANPYYNTGVNHTDYTQSHAMPQSPFQQSHSNTTGTTSAQHLPVYQHSPYSVHPIPPHAHPGYVTSTEHSVLQYAPTIHHPHGAARWTNSLETEEPYRQDDPEPDYEMDHQPQDQQQQPHMHSMQAPTATHESQTHANLQPHPPITSVSQQPEQMSPATRPGVIRTGKSHHNWLKIFK